MNDRTRHILFDMDGTLASSLPVMRDIYRQFLESHGVQGSEAEFQHMNGFALPQIVAHLKQTHALVPPVSALHHGYRGMMDQRLRLGVPLMPGARELLPLLHGHGYALRLVTSAERAQAEAFLERNAIRAYFEAIISGQDVARSKPDPDIYLLASADLDKSRTVAVEDSANGVLSAKGAGLRVVALAEPGAQQSLKNAGADTIISCLRDLPAHLGEP